MRLLWGVCCDRLIHVYRMHGDLGVKGPKEGQAVMIITVLVTVQLSGAGVQTPPASPLPSRAGVGTANKKEMEKQPQAGPVVGRSFHRLN